MAYNTNRTSYQSKRAISKCLLELPIVLLVLLVSIVYSRGAGAAVGRDTEKTNQMRRVCSSSRRVFLGGELQRWKEAISVAKARGISLRGFYHTSSWQTHWRDVIEEQLMTMDGRRPANFLNGSHPMDQGKIKSGNRFTKAASIYWTEKRWASVLEYANALYMNVAGPSKQDMYKIGQAVDNLGLKNRNKIILNFNKTVDRMEYRNADENRKKYLMSNKQLSAGESATTMAMHDYCRAEKAAGRKAFVFYLHGKGGCCSRKEKTRGDGVNPVASWREVMNTFNIEFPSICMRALLSGFSTCGMEYQDAHYSGNFYWANCDHLAALPDLNNRFDPWAVEFWELFMSPHHNHRMVFGENCAYSAHNCRGVNHYDHECYRSTYRQKIIDYVSKPQLPRNPVGTANGSFEWVAKTCGDLRRRPYKTQTFWNDPNMFPIRRTRESDYAKGA